ncbi:uncharacterized protein LOC125047698 [Penaeus chinensis]|uniref:uncharacterized protein LOC125047698 n=1 Tax=Penaeus chinensis TaxID=139456 RepID=UPI001FB6D564|nr:uncharacterized protein LOC125047698 [Penaeus chinensis]
MLCRNGFPLSIRNCFLVFLAVSLALLCFLVHFPKNSYQPNLQRIKPPMPETIQLKDSIFKKNCYSYSNIVATNMCCKMLKYDFPLIEKCLKTFNVTRNIPKPTENSQNLNSTSKEIIHIVLIGDSHMRYLFSAVSLRLASPDLRYRKKESKKWSYGTTALKKMRNQHLVTTLETKHLTLPIRVTYHTDFFLEGLPRIMDLWEKGKEIKPTAIFMDSGLHFMTKRPDLKAIPYEKSLIKLKPYFTRLAATVPVYYKLTDDLQAARHQTHKMSRNLTKLYNEIAVRELQGTGVTVWDSTIPLSAQYNDACAKKNRNTPPLFRWKCNDARHLGYIVVDQFANMVYNALCNKYLDREGDYCGLEERRVVDGL